MLVGPVAARPGWRSSSARACPAHSLKAVPPREFFRRELAWEHPISGMSKLERPLMTRVCLTLLLCAATAAAQYKVEPAGAPPPELDAAIAGALQKEGAKIVAANGSVVCEIWLRTTMPSGPKANEEGVTLPTIPHGALLGAIRFPVPGSERRGQSLKPGVYYCRVEPGDAAARITVVR